MSIFNHNYITIDSIIEYLYKDGKELTADALIKLADPNTSTHELLELLCVYINSMSKFFRKEDAGFICKLQVKNSELVAMLQSIRERYDKAVTELVESKRSEIDLASKVIQVSVTSPNVESYDLSLKIKDFDEFIKKHCSDNYIYAMEACGNSNYWADKIAKQGGAVYIFPAQKCRSYNHGCKDDRGDARGVRDLLLTYIASPEAATVHPCVIRDRQSRVYMEIVNAYGDIQSDLTMYLRRLIAFFKEQDATLCYSYSMSPEETIRKANEYTAKLQFEDADANFSLITYIQDQCAIITLILKRRQNIYAAF